MMALWFSALCLEGGLDIGGGGSVLGREGGPNADGFVELPEVVEVAGMVNAGDAHATRTFGACPGP
jgi:hypothetical protein